MPGAHEIGKETAVASDFQDKAPELTIRRQPAKAG
jgi:hypothetical protein